MVVLGLVLLVGAGVFTAAAITSNTGTVGADLWGLHLSNLSLGGVFVAGMVAGVVAVFGLVLLIGGMRRSARMSRERRQLARENARLARRQEDADRAATSAADNQVLPVNRKTAVAPAPVPADSSTERTVERTDRTDRVDSTDARPATEVREREVVQERVPGARASDEEFVPAGAPEPSVTERMKARAARWRR